MKILSKRRKNIKITLIDKRKQIEYEKAREKIMKSMKISRNGKKRHQYKSHKKSRENIG